MDFVSWIHRGDRFRLDVEVLKELIKLLPEKHEVRENCWSPVFFLFLLLFFFSLLR